MNFKGWFVKSGSGVDSGMWWPSVDLSFKNLPQMEGERIGAGKVNKMEKELFLMCGRKEWS